MSLLSHQSAVNKTLNFWGNDGGTGTGAYPPFLVSYLDNENYTFTQNITSIFMLPVASSIVFPDLPFDVVYSFNCSVNYKYVSGADDFGFELTSYLQGGGLAPGVSVQATASSLTGWKNVSNIRQIHIPANSGTQTLGVYLRRLTPSPATLTGNYGLILIGYPATIAP